MTSHQPRKERNHSVILFYKYFLPSDFSLLQENPRHYEQVLLDFLKKTCQRLELKGRLLVAAEGVNGTLSAPHRKRIDDFIQTVEKYELSRESESLDDAISMSSMNHPDAETATPMLFSDIDWKHSTSTSEPFPDLKIVIVKEIISSGDAVSVCDVKEFGGRHLNPADFHRVIQDDPNVVLIDVRNPIEYEIGHFVHPSEGAAPTINPNMVTFASFDSGFCAKQADELKDKKVLMYCTGGIRCEKASAMLKKRGVKDVSQLKGGIHRYLEEFGDDGYFRGLNFVFDRRVAMSASEAKESLDEAKQSTQEVVGRCFECDTPFEEVSGSNICTVCRDVCLMCHDCKAKLREYHCRRHAAWKKCYFTFLEVFDRDELDVQRQMLVAFRDATMKPDPQKNKNMRRTLTKQIDKVAERIQELDLQTATFDRNAPQRCRSCFEPSSKCDGCCWGFWKAPIVDP
ncbi:hypothetical protein MPSEU_001053200 [Mayamaea pseudoterrestris]|nr:hypothetical protein MPSEU_001053200 [Mayamaea pseudoterrestris]